MPGLDGLETARLIKGRARTRDTPIVFLTAARDEIGDVVRGYGVGAVDYVLKPYDPELLRSKVAVFAELESSRRALKRSEAFLRGAFEAAPIGKTVLDARRRIVRSNPAFARLVGRDPPELQGVDVADLAAEEDRRGLLAALALVAGNDDAAVEPSSLDLRLRLGDCEEVWVEAVVSSIEPSEYAEPLMLVQWVDLTARRRAEEARADLLLEQAARAEAELTTDRLRTLQRLTDAIESLSLDPLLEVLAQRLAELFDVGVAEVQVFGELDQPVIVRAADGVAVRVAGGPDPPPSGSRWDEAPMLIERVQFGMLRLAVPVSRTLRGRERALLQEVADRAALSIRRAQLHEQEHRISEELQRGLLPGRLPRIAGVDLAAHYQAAGVGAEAGGDWYDAFALPGDRVGMVVGDVAGRGVRAASTMGQLRSVTRAFALSEEGSHAPGDVLTRLNRYQLALPDEDELFTVIYAIVDPRAGVLTWASAGHPPPLLASATGAVSYLEGGEGLMGLGEVSYRSIETPIGPGDALILYSDGLVERRGESLDVGLGRLARAATDGPVGAEELREHLLRRILPAGHELHDDVTAMIARVTGR
jgi:PAS domain S-box-containing protein